MQRRRKWGWYEGQQARGGIFRHFVLGGVVAVIACTAMLAFAAPTRKSTERKAKFDSDSIAIGVDNRCSVCISGYLEDFIGKPVPSSKVIRGFNHVHTTGILEGTLRYNGRTTMDENMSSPYRTVFMFRRRRFASSARSTGHSITNDNNVPMEDKI